jgi:fermentation-respiration switch protein FrsA (DUF1100 family)
MLAWSRFARAGSPIHVMIPSVTTSTTSFGRGGLLAIAFAALALGGLVLWFTGANMAEGTHSAGELAERVNSVDRAIAGAVVLIAAMVLLLAYARWLAMRFASNAAVKLGAAILALGGLTHLAENILVIRLYSGDIAAGDGLWDVISAMSNSAFALLGVGVLVAALGLTPRWLKIWGVVTGILGVASGLSAFAPSVSFLAGPFNVSLLTWLIVVGVRYSRPAP